MAASVLTPADSRRVDLDQLNLLAVFHFVGAGLGAVGLLFLLGHYAVLRALVFAPGAWMARHHAPLASQVRLIFLRFDAVIGLWFATSGAGNLASGFLLRARRGRIFSMVVAGFNCAHMPLGTALGVFALVILSRDSVRQLYLARVGNASGPGGPIMVESAPSQRLAIVAPPPVSPPPPELPPETGGDLTGGIIPYKNPQALTAYYLAVFGLIPAIGFILAALAVPFGVAGLRARARHPVVRGRIHAWIGIVLGSLDIGIQLLLVAMILIRVTRHGH